MSIIQALRQAKAATAEQTTEPDLSVPLISRSFSTTNGSVVARFAENRFMADVGHVYKFTIESAAGTVAGDDLTLSCKRDNDEEISGWTAAAPQAINDPGWIDVEYGLQVRFLDNATTPTWTQDETFQITCEPFTAIVVKDGIRSVEVNLG